MSPLHKDDPHREGNMSDDEWEALTRQRMKDLGTEGLHTIPADVLAAATAAAKAQAEKP